MRDTILITGGAGFIGSCLVRQIVADQRQTSVVNLDKLTYAGNLESLQSVVAHSQHKFVCGDICDGDLMKRILREERPGAIVHLAAESHVDRSIDGPAAFVATNVVGTCTLLEATRQYWQALTARERDRFRFLHVSTDEVYGSLGPSGSFQETTPYSPRSPYSASKAAADHFVGAYYHTYGLPTIVTNTCNNFGPYQFPEKLIPLVIVNAIGGKPLPVYGDGLHVRDWLFVEDHCRALRLVLRRGAAGETYNIGADCQRTNLDVVRQICRLVDERLPESHHAPCERLIERVADRPGHDRRYAIDATKLRRDLGWEPSCDFDSALATTVEWYLNNADWVKRATNGKYCRERLGLLKAA